MGSMFGGGVKQAAPDPQLVAAQTESIRSQMGIAQKQQALAEQMQPTQMEQLKFGIDASRQTYEQTQQDRQYALAKRDQYDKALGGLLNETEKFDEASRRLELGQQAAADVSRAFSGAGEQQRRGMSRMGVNPLSGKALMADQGVELEEARARAEASRMVSAAAREEGINLKKGAVSMLQGYPGMASQLSPVSARLGWGGVDVANAGVSGLSSGNMTSSDLAGAYGENAGTMYKAQSGLWSQAQSGNAARQGELLGTVAGAATRYGASKMGSFGGGSGKFVPGTTEIAEMRNGPDWM